MGARNPADRPERIDQMNVLDRNIGIVETKVDADVPDGTSSGSAPRGVRRLVLPLWRARPFSPPTSFSPPPPRSTFFHIPAPPSPPLSVLLSSPLFPATISA